MSAGSGNRTSVLVQALDHKSNSLTLGTAPEAVDSIVVIFFPQFLEYLSDNSYQI